MGFWTNLRVMAAGCRWRHAALVVVAGVLALTLSPAANAQIVFVADDQGRVGRYDIATSTGTFLGSLSGSGFTPNQVIGIAYDSINKAVLIFDRSANAVYSMNASTGTTTQLFTTPGVQLQGGAVRNGLIFGINEGTQKLAAYSFTGVDQNLTGPSLSSHVHALGLDAGSNSLVIMSSSGGLRKMNPDGTEGSVILTSTQTGSLNAEDVEAFNGNFLIATYGRDIIQMNGTTGAQTTFLSSTVLSSMGVTSSMSGVALVIPEPETWALMLSGTGWLAWRSWRRRRTAA